MGVRGYGVRWEPFYTTLLLNYMAKGVDAEYYEKERWVSAVIMTFNDQKHEQNRLKCVNTHHPPSQ